MAGSMLWRREFLECPEQSDCSSQATSGQVAARCARAGASIK